LCYYIVMCKFDGCGRTKLVAFGLCGTHYAQRRRGKELTPIQVAEHVDRIIDNDWRYSKDGYVVKRGVNGNKYQHRIVMEEILGRPLLSHENVHHINGNRADNRPENLELWNTSQPKGQRVEDKVAWAREILDLYG